MNKTLIKIVIGAAALTPLFVYAASVRDIIVNIERVLTTAIPTLMILATVVFLWGVIRYITSGGDEEKLTQGKQFIIFGLVGLFIMLAAWGVVRALVNTFGLERGGIPGGPF